MNCLMRSCLSKCRRTLTPLSGPRTTHSKHQLFSKWEKILARSHFCLLRGIPVGCVVVAQGTPSHSQVLGWVKEPGDIWKSCPLFKVPVNSALEAVELLALREDGGGGRSWEWAVPASMQFQSTDLNLLWVTNLTIQSQKAGWGKLSHPTTPSQLQTQQEDRDFIIQWADLHMDTTVLFQPNKICFLHFPEQQPSQGKATTLPTPSLLQRAFSLKQPSQLTPFLLKKIYLSFVPYGFATACFSWIAILFILNN